MGGAYQLVAAAVEVESAKCLEEVHQDANLALWQLQESAAVALMVVGEEPFSEDLWNQQEFLHQIQKMSLHAVYHPTSGAAQLVEAVEED